MPLFARDPLANRLDPLGQLGRSPAEPLGCFGDGLACLDLRIPGLPGMTETGMVLPECRAGTPYIGAHGRQVRV
jgi:hypothetical protein